MIFWYRRALCQVKAMSHRTFRAALRSSGSNEVSRFYEDSLARTSGDTAHAKLNTQRKILIVMWAIWRNNKAYNPEIVYPSTPTAAAVRQAA